MKILKYAGTAVLYSSALILLQCSLDLKRWEFCGERRDAVVRCVAR
jgi:hypothetical protein